MCHSFTTSYILGCYSPVMLNVKMMLSLFLQTLPLIQPFSYSVRRGTWLSAYFRLYSDHSLWLQVPMLPLPPAHVDRSAALLGEYEGVARQIRSSCHQVALLDRIHSIKVPPPASRLTPSLPCQLRTADHHPLQCDA